jgi:hypothetical protein
MKLPEIKHPIYTITVPISKNKIKFRPWLVGEQKILLMANESDDSSSMVDALIQILNNCLISNIDLSKLPQVDVEYYFYQLRGKSQSEIVETKYKCEHKVNDTICGNRLEHRFNLTTDLEIINVDVDSLIKLTETVGIKFNTPKFEIKDLTIDFSTLTTKDLFDEIIQNIDYIYDENSTYKKEDMSTGELLKFLENLSSSQFEPIDKFFSNLPKIIKTLDIKCNKCGFDHHIVAEDIFSFFL